MTLPARNDLEGQICATILREKYPSGPLVKPITSTATNLLANGKLALKSYQPTGRENFVGYCGRWNSRHGSAAKNSSLCLDAGLAGFTSWQRRPID